MAIKRGTNGNDFFYDPNSAVTPPPHYHVVKLTDHGDKIYPMAGNDQIQAGSGDDTIFFGPYLNEKDLVYGELGFDTVVLDGNYKAGLTLGDRFLNNEEIKVEPGHDYTLTIKNSVVLNADGYGSVAHFIVDASKLHSGDVLDLDARAVTNGGNIEVFGGDGNDIIETGQKNDPAQDGDVIYGGLGNDFISSGGCNDTIHDNGGNNTIYGGSGNDRIELTGVGTDKIYGGAGADSIEISPKISLDSTIDGGAGVDDLLIETHLANLILPGSLFTSIEELTVQSMHGELNVKLNDANVAPGKILLIQPLAANGQVTVDGSAETDGHLHIWVQPGTTYFDFTGGALNDQFYAGNILTASDRIDGGGGADTVTITGGDITLGPDTLTNVEKLVLQGIPNAIDIVTNDGTVAAGKTLVVDGRSTEGYIFDGSAETNGKFNITGGVGNDDITGGAGNDVIAGNAGADVLTGGGGQDHFLYTAVADSTGASFDTITDFDASSDVFNLWFTVGGVDPAVSGGSLSLASFDSDLANAIGNHQLSADHAVLFSPDAGDFSGKLFLIVDANGQAGYQAEQDLVIELGNPSSAETLSTHNFV